MAFTEPLADFLQTADFAEAATIGASTVNGIFDKDYGEALGIVGGSKPLFLCKAADLPAITLGTTTITVAAGTFTIVENQPDGHGLTNLVLEA